MNGELRRPDFQAAVDRLGTTGTFGIKRTVQSAAARLRADETVQVLWVAADTPAESLRLSELVTGLLVLTDRRLYYVLESTVAQRFREYPLAQIESVDWSAGLVMAKLTIVAGGHSHVFEGAMKKLGHVMAEELRVRSGNRVAGPVPALDAAGEIRADLRAVVDVLTYTHRDAWLRRTQLAVQQRLLPTEVVRAACVGSVAADSSDVEFDGVGGEDFSSAVVGGMVATVASIRPSEMADGLLVLTNSRLLFIVDSKVAQRTAEFALAELGAVQWSGRMMFGTLTLTASGQQQRFTLPKSDGPAFTEALQAAVDHRVMDQATVEIRPVARRAPIPPQPIRPGSPGQRSRPAPQGQPVSRPRPVGPPPGWYQNPDNPRQRRWWDGTVWTEHIQ